MINIIHLSDIHFKENLPEQISIILNELKDDLIVQSRPEDNNVLVISGDIVKAGSSEDQFRGFSQYLENLKNNLKIEKVIICAGNHDVCTKTIQNKQVIHEALVSSVKTENDFIEAVQSDSIFIEKFKNFVDFVKSSTSYDIEDNITGYSHEIESIGFFCLNTAIFSSGGLKPSNGKYIDKSRLCIDTRPLYSWLRETKSKLKVLIMHHPLDWLSEWSREELNKIIKKHFNLVMHGHIHEQDSLQTLDSEKVNILLSAPPLFTSKHDKLGYSIVRVNTNYNVEKVTYRQWTKQYKFVSGVDFSNNDAGEIEITSSSAQKQNIFNSHIESYYEAKLQSALQSFTSQPKLWITPEIKSTPENSISHKAEEIQTLDVEKFVSNPRNLIIKSPPQFGLTCFSLYLCKEAAKKKKFWMVIDCKEINRNNVNKEIEEIKTRFSISNAEIEAILIDSTSSSGTEDKVIKQVKSLLPDKPLIIMETIDSPTVNIKENRLHLGTETFYLWALTKEKIRKIVTHYNTEKNIGEDTAVMNRVSNDLVALNLHRTPMNCLTLLKVLEFDFDESPVNRTEMIKRMLFILFNVESIPSYKSKPDLKDCEYLLGKLSERMLIENITNFSRDYFISTLRSFCRENLIELEVELVFDILLENYIFVRIGNNFGYRFSYWIYYFAAQRMYHSDEFKAFIYSGMRYVRYPEIIEFYTGIDRKREDALEVILNHLNTSSRTVEEKCGLTSDLDVYDLMKWEMSPEVADKIKNELSDEVKSSNLPTEIKDHYSDQFYDRYKPYNQNPMQILEDYSVLILMQAVRAGSRALRNSDYVNPSLKRDLLNALVSAWKIMNKVVLVIAPALAQDGTARIDGAGFRLVGDFGEHYEDRVQRIITVIPSNIIDWYKHDLFSRKMAPLIYEMLLNSDDRTIQHKIALLLLSERPKGWKEKIEQYIASVNKNSFFLLDIFLTLSHMYRYSYLDTLQINDVKFLIKKSLAKHIHGINNPGSKAVSRISDKALPERSVN